MLSIFKLRFTPELFHKTSFPYFSSVVFTHVNTCKLRLMQIIMFITRGQWRAVSGAEAEWRLPCYRKFCASHNKQVSRGTGGEGRKEDEVEGREWEEEREEGNVGKMRREVCK